MSNSVADELYKLSRLRSEGAMNQAEYEAQRALLLQGSPAMQLAVPSGPPRRKRHRLVLLTVPVVIAAAILVSQRSSGSKVHITHRLDAVVVLDPRHVQVWITWKNIDKRPGTVRCTIKVITPSIDGHQFVSATVPTGPAGTLQPGQTQNAYQVVPVSNHTAGAISAREISVTGC